MLGPLEGSLQYSCLNCPFKLIQRSVIFSVHFMFFFIFFLARQPVLSTVRFVNTVITPSVAVWLFSAVCDGPPRRLPALALMYMVYLKKKKKKHYEMYICTSAPCAHKHRKGCLRARWTRRPCKRTFCQNSNGNISRVNIARFKRTETNV